ncbi:MAG TPA: aminodeoxychorismate synthase component I [Actinocrinis sp.]|jgi:para-aminobenzoate synthetase
MRICRAACFTRAPDPSARPPCSEALEHVIDILLIDNHDSYTYNLFQLIAEESGCEPVVVANDDPRWARLDLDDFDAAVLSPGPGRPSVEADFGHCRDVFRHGRIPVLGVCLGHQGLGEAAGARVVPAPQPRHGHLTTVTHTGDALFSDIPQQFTAVRYHSLCLADPLPDELLAIARAEDGVVMAVRHRSRPWWGVQFHPESVASEHGAQTIRNFRRVAWEAASDRRSRSVRPVPVGPAPVAPAAEADRAAGAAARAGAERALEIRHTVIDAEVDAEAVFDALYRQSSPLFWLDSARVDAPYSRFSFLGDTQGPLGETVEYRVHDGQAQVRRGTSQTVACPGSIFDVLDERLRALTAAPDPALPFEFAGGYVGYFGYELRADCGSPHGHRSPGHDAQWLFCDRFVAIDHVEARTYAVALCPPEAAAETDAWLQATAKLLADLPIAARRREQASPATAAAADSDSASAAAVAQERRDRTIAHAASHLARDKAGYLADIAECQRQLHAGESYELCLTTTATLPGPADPVDCYRRLRAANPAPYAALLRFGDTWVLSSSPERFLRVDRRRVIESKPIKGTAPRSDDPARDEAARRSLQTDPKTRAENLMIVDLLRNDLGRVCEVGSVHVPAFLATESYATVHQLVSTVRGRLRPEVPPVAAVRACFPGGSMTGAPKLRSMEILDRLEGRLRGIYSGAIGYLSASGTADLSIVIRTAVVSDDALTIGAGGAIVLDSDPDDEYDEMLVKAAAALQAVMPDD